MAQWSKQSPKGPALPDVDHQPNDHLQARGTRLLVADYRLKAARAGCGIILVRNLHNDVIIDRSTDEILLSPHRLVINVTCTSKRPRIDSRSRRCYTFTYAYQSRQKTYSCRDDAYWAEYIVRTSWCMICMIGWRKSDQLNI